jgi:hypothetical protein
MTHKLQNMNAEKAISPKLFKPCDTSSRWSRVLVVEAGVVGGRRRGRVKSLDDMIDEVALRMIY